MMNGTNSLRLWMNRAASRSRANRNLLHLRMGPRPMHAQIEALKHPGPPDLIVRLWALAVRRASDFSFLFSRDLKHDTRTRKGKYNESVSWQNTSLLAAYLAVFTRITSWNKHKIWYHVLVKEIVLSDILVAPKCLTSNKKLKTVKKNISNRNSIWYEVIQSWYLSNT
jgi:hypothetical protein